MPGSRTGEYMRHLCIVVAAAAALGVGGCSVGFQETEHGTYPVVGVRVDEAAVRDAGQSVTNLAGLLFGPAGATAATAILGLGGIAARQYGNARASKEREKGARKVHEVADATWDEARARMGGDSAPAGAGASLGHGS